MSEHRPNWMRIAELFEEACDEVKSIRKDRKLLVDPEHVRIRNGQKKLGETLRQMYVEVTGKAVDVTQPWTDVHGVRQPGGAHHIPLDIGKLRESLSSVELASDMPGGVPRTAIVSDPNYKPYGAIFTPEPSSRKWDGPGWYKVVGSKVLHWFSVFYTDKTFYPSTSICGMSKVDSGARMYKTVEAYPKCQKCNSSRLVCQS